MSRAPVITYRVIQLSVLVLSFSQAIILYMYYLKYDYNYGNPPKFSQHVAALRSISQEGKTVNTEHDMGQAELCELVNVCLVSQMHRRPTVS